MGIFSPSLVTRTEKVSLLCSSATSISCSAYFSALFSRLLTILVSASRSAAAWNEPSPGRSVRRSPPVSRWSARTLDDALQLHRNVETHEVEPHLVRIDVAEVEQLADQPSRRCVFLWMTCRFFSSFGSAFISMMSSSGPLMSVRGVRTSWAISVKKSILAPYSSFSFSASNSRCCSEYLLAFASQVVAESGGEPPATMSR